MVKNANARDVSMNGGLGYQIPNNALDADPISGEDR